MTKRRKQAIILLALSVPMMWFGFTNFMAGGISSTIQAIGVAIGCVFGMFSALSGLIMLITKNSLGILNPDDKGRGEDLLASQTKVGDSPIQKTINKKVNEMAKADTSVDLMKREKELETRRKELESLLAEVTKEEKAVEKELLSKGWVQKNGSWGIK
tara:strand:+ start:224 stop:697 length:474 start_codon:yes stop_codon:yes gene_type:complete